MQATPGSVEVIRHLAFEDLGLFAETLSSPDWTVRYHEAGLEDLAAPLRSRPRSPG